MCDSLFLITAKNCVLPSSRTQNKDTCSSVCTHVFWTGWSTSCSLLIPAQNTGELNSARFIDCPNWWCFVVEKRQWRTLKQLQKNSEVHLSNLCHVRLRNAEFNLSCLPKTDKWNQVRGIKTINHRKLEYETKLRNFWVLDLVLKLIFRVIQVAQFAPMFLSQAAVLCVYFSWTKLLNFSIA